MASPKSRPGRRGRGIAGALLLVVAGLLAACGATDGAPSTTGGASSTPPPAAGIRKIAHVGVIQQENRSFDTYFGTYPGTDGIPMAGGQPTVCVADPHVNGQCVGPYPDHADVNGGGPHGAANATAYLDGGKMDGFVAQAVRARKGCTDANNPGCTNSRIPDVMGYHTQSDIPNYWAYARNFVLQDHMFEPNA